MPLLSEGVGWAVISGVGFAFAGVIIVLSAIQTRYTRLSIKDNDEFSSASRSVKQGLVASGIVSAATWSSAILVSTTVTFVYGISGAYWYSAGASVQLFLCSMSACKIKLNAPFCTTFLEIPRVRFGAPTHIVMICFALATNLFVSLQLVLGGSAVVNVLTGVNIMAAIWLIPLSVAVYCCVGGMRATLMADYLHTCGVLGILMYFFFKVWYASDVVGGVAGLVEAVRGDNGIASNAGGALLTFRSQNGLIFGVICIVGGFGGVFVDQAYHQRGIASNPATAASSFLLGASAWFPIPLLAATTFGLAARAIMKTNPELINLTMKGIGAGLVAPSTAIAVAGKAGSVAMLIVLFLAVTSASSAEQIAVSSILTFDVYKTYIRPQASKREIFIVQHINVVIWAICMALVGLVFHYINIGLGWVYTMTGIIIAPAVAPIFATIAWRKTTSTACLAGMLVGLPLGVMAWLVSAYTHMGAVTVATTGASIPTVIGNCVSLLTSALLTVVITLLWPNQEDDFIRTRLINAPEQIDSQHGTESADDANDSTEKKADLGQDVQTLEHSFHAAEKTQDPYWLVRAAGLDPAALESTYRKFTYLCLGAAGLLWIVIPACLCASREWSVTGVTAWIWIGFLWLFWSVLSVAILPIFESRKELGHILGGMWRDITWQKK